MVKSKMVKRSVTYTINKIAEKKAEESAMKVDLAYIEFFIKEFNKRYKTKLKIVGE